MSRKFTPAELAEIRLFNGIIPRDHVSQALVEQKFKAKWSDPEFLDIFFKGKSVGHASQQVTYIRGGKAFAVAKDWSTAKLRDAGKALDRLPTAQKNKMTNIMTDMYIGTGTAGGVSPRKVSLAEEKLAAAQMKEMVKQQAKQQPKQAAKVEKAVKKVDTAKAREAIRAAKEENLLPKSGKMKLTDIRSLKQTSRSMPETARQTKTALTPAMEEAAEVVRQQAAKKAASKMITAAEFDALAATQEPMRRAGGHKHTMPWSREFNAIAARSLGERDIIMKIDKLLASGRPISPAAKTRIDTYLDLARVTIDELVREGGAGSKLISDYIPKFLREGSNPSGYTKGTKMGLRLKAATPEIAQLAEPGIGQLWGLVPKTVDLMKSIWDRIRGAAPGAAEAVGKAAAKTGKAAGKAGKLVAPLAPLVGPAGIALGAAADASMAYDAYQKLRTEGSAALDMGKDMKKAILESMDDNSPESQQLRKLYRMDIDTTQGKTGGI